MIKLYYLNYKITCMLASLVVFFGAKGSLSIPSIQKETFTHVL